MKRCEGTDETITKKTAIGLVPADNALRLDGLSCPVDMKELFSTPKSYWQEDIKELRNYFQTQVGVSMPAEINQQLDELEKRIEAL